MKASWVSLLPWYHATIYTIISLSYPIKKYVEKIQTGRLCSQGMHGM